MATGIQRATEILEDIKCDICDTYKDVLWRCFYCQETLCDQCQTYHSKSRATRDHTITELANTNDENQGTSIFCQYHENEGLQKYCKTCNVLVCLECTIGAHQEHEYKQIGAIIKENKTQLEEVFEQITTKTIPELEQSIVYMTQKEEIYSEEIENIRRKITTRGENLKQATDKLIDTIRNELMQQTKKDEQNLKETKKLIDQNLKTLKSQLSEQEQRMQKLSGIDIINNAANIKESLSKLTRNTVEIPSVQPPRFQTGENNEENLKNMIGKLIMKKSLAEHAFKTKQMIEPSLQKTTVSHKISQDPPRFQTGEDNEDNLKKKIGRLSLKKTLTEHPCKQESKDQTKDPKDPDDRIWATISHKISQDQTIYDKENGHKNHHGHADPLPENSKNLNVKLMKDQKKSTADNSKFNDIEFIKGNMVFSFHVKGMIKKIRMLDDNKAWLLIEHVGTFFSSEYQKLKLVNDKGQCLISAKLDIFLADMATTKSGELLVTTGSDQPIMRMSRSGEIDIFADLSPYNTHGIHVTQNGDVIVGLCDGNFYTTEITRLSSKGQILQVIDITYTGLHLSSPRRIIENVNQDIVMISEMTGILVVNKEGRLRFKYRRQPKHLNTTGWIKPTEIVCSQNGQILIADRRINNIHVLSKDGVFIQLLLTEDQAIDQPQALELDKNGKLWVGGGNGQVFIIELL